GRLWLATSDGSFAGQRCSDYRFQSEPGAMNDSNACRLSHQLLQATGTTRLRPGPVQPFVSAFRCGERHPEPIALLCLLFFGSFLETVKGLFLRQSPRRARRSRAFKGEAALSSKNRYLFTSES